MANRLRGDQGQQGRAAPGLGRQSQHLRQSTGGSLLLASWWAREWPRSSNSGRQERIFPQGRHLPQQAHPACLSYVLRRKTSACSLTSGRTRTSRFGEPVALQSFLPAGPPPELFASEQHPSSSLLVPVCAPSSPRGAPPESSCASGQRLLAAAAAAGGVVQSLSGRLVPHPHSCPDQGTKLPSQVSTVHVVVVAAAAAASMKCHWSPEDRATEPGGRRSAKSATEVTSASTAAMDEQELINGLTSESQRCPSDADLPTCQEWQRASAFAPESVGWPRNSSYQHTKDVNLGLLA